MITLDRVSKAFGGRRALDAVSLDVHRGEILALLGHNGAGKSTLFALVLGLLRPTEGDIRVRGVSVRRHPRRVRQGVGSVLAPAFYGYLSGWDNLRVLTSYSAPVGGAEMAAVVRLVGLEDRIHDRVRQYSHGMRRRLALAQALLPRPDLLLLDEWESGLDPAGRDDMRALIQQLNREHGVTVVLSSHHLAGLDGLAERLAILRAGRLVFLDDRRALDGGGRTVRLELDDWQRALPALRAQHAQPQADGAVVLAPGSDVADLVTALVQAGVRVHAVERQRSALEESYLRAPEESEVDGVSAPARRCSRRSRRTGSRRWRP